MFGMKKYVRLAAVFVVAAVLAACAGCAGAGVQKAAGSAGGTVSVKVDLTRKMEGKIRINTAVPRFSGFPAAEQLNAKIRKVSDDGIEGLKQSTKDLGDTAGSDSLFYQSYFDYSLNAGVLSVWINSDNYAGGAHGFRWIRSFTVNTKTGEFYSSLGSLFLKPEEGKKQISDKITAQIKSSPDLYFPEAVQTVADKKGDFPFYLDGGKMTVYFDLYEIAPYVGGIRTFEFPLRELKLRVPFDEPKPQGKVKLNGTDIAFSGKVVSNEQGEYLPLLETAKVLGHAVADSNGKYTVDKNAVEAKMINGAAYAPLTFFSGTLNDFLLYDGDILKMYRQTADPITVAPVSTESPSEDILAYVRSCDVKDQKIVYDPVEWIAKEDTARIRELKLDAVRDFPNGFYLYNPIEESDTGRLSQNVQFWVTDGSITSKTDQNGFLKRLQEYKAPYHLTVQNGSIIKIEEQYLP